MGRADPPDLDPKATGHSLRISVSPPITAPFAHWVVGPLAPGPTIRPRSLSLNPDLLVGRLFPFGKDNREHALFHLCLSLLRDDGTRQGH